MDSMNMEKKEVPSDVVELIIAVDLNPKDPQEPINVNDVSVKPKGEASQDGEDWKKLTMQVLMGDPRSGVQSDSVSYDEAVEAVSRVLGDPMPEEKEDPFSKLTSSTGESEKPGDMPKRKSGGMKGTLDRILNLKEEKDYEEEEEEF